MQGAFVLTAPVGCDGAGWGQNGIAHHGRSAHFFCFSSCTHLLSLLWTPAVPMPLQQLSCLSSRGVGEVPVLV